MRVRLEDLSPEKRAAVQDFKTDITSVFNNFYEDSWDEERWDRAVRKLPPVPSPPDRRTNPECMRNMWIERCTTVGVRLEALDRRPCALS